MPVDYALLLVSIFCVFGILLIYLGDRKLTNLRGPGCGNCLYEVSEDLTKTCPECGTSRLEAGIITPSVLARRGMSRRIVWAVLILFSFGAGFVAYNRAILGARIVSHQELSTRYLVTDTISGEYLDMKVVVSAEQPRNVRDRYDVDLKIEIVWQGNRPEEQLLKIAKTPNEEVDIEIKMKFVQNVSDILKDMGIPVESPHFAVTVKLLQHIVEQLISDPSRAVDSRFTFRESSGKFRELNMTGNRKTIIRAAGTVGSRVDSRQNILGKLTIDMIVYSVFILIISALLITVEIVLYKEIYR